MKFLVPNYSCLQNPWLGGYRPQIPILSVLYPQLNLLNPPPNKIPGYATGSSHFIQEKRGWHPVWQPVGPEIHSPELGLYHPTPEQRSLPKYNAKLPQQKTNQSRCPVKSPYAITFVLQDRRILHLTLRWNDCYQFDVWELRNIRRTVQAADLASSIVSWSAESQIITTLLAKSVVFFTVERRHKECRDFVRSIWCVLDRASTW